MMQTVSINQFKYTMVQHADDVTSLPLMRNLFGLNNRIYINLGSLSFEKDDATYQQLLKTFTPQELRFGCLNRLYECHISVRDESGDVDEEYTTYEKMDFKEVLELVKKNAKKIEHDTVRIYASYGNDNNDGQTDKQRGILNLPLGSKILMTAANYAYQEIEQIKLDNYMQGFTNSAHVKNFLNVF